nr:OmpA family protein [Pseudomonas koreensis]
MTDLINKQGSFAVKIIIALGIFASWGYCAFSINFFPTGLNIADSLVFIFIALGFGLLYSAWLLFGFMAFFFGHSAWTDKSSRLTDGLACIIFLCFLLYIAFELGSAEASIAPLISGFLLHSSIFQWKKDSPDLDEESKRNQTRLRWTMILFSIFVVPTLALPVFGKIIDSSFGLIGIQQKNVSLALNDENQKVVSDVAKEFNLSIYGCLKDGNQTNIVHHFNVLWHGLGERSLVQLLAYEKGDWKPKAKIELDRNGLKVLTPTDKKNSFKTCLTVNTDTLFDIYEDTISDHGKKQLAEFTKETKRKLEADNLKILSANISGHTDRVPVMKAGDSNLALSMRRADSVYAEIKDLFADLPESQVKRLGQGSLAPKSNCPRNLSMPEQKECLAVDRRVEIELKVQLKGK